MKEFPGTLSVKNQANFPDMNFQRLKCYLRRELFEHIISHAETDYFSLDFFLKKIENMQNEQSIEIVQKILKELIPELEELGWHCKFCFGNTGLFIYSTDQPPQNCWIYTDDVPN